MEAVRLFEVSPRDGLQNEAEIVGTEHKIAYIRKLVEAGFRDIEAVSMVRPRYVPQLADASAVAERLPRVPDVRYWALVPNTIGMDRALDAGFRHVATFLSASETHNKKNVNRTVKESLAGLQKVIATGVAEQVTVRSYISTAFGCPYEGEVDPQAVVRIALALREVGARYVVLGDTTGMGDPRKVEVVLEALTKAGVPLDRIGMHFHDTRGTALTNSYAAWQLGIRMFDASVAGIGGCPYAPGAAGNVATEDLVHLFESLGSATGVDLDLACAAGDLMEEILGRPLPGRYHQFAKGQRVRASRRSA